MTELVTLTKDRPVLSSERAPHKNKIGLDTKADWLTDWLIDWLIDWLTDWLTDRRSQCDFDFNFDFDIDRVSSGAVTSQS
jgi:hypothetical protein